MSTIVTRASKGASLSWNEMDANLTNLNNDKVETSALASYETSAHAAATYETQTHVAATYETQSHASNTYLAKASNLGDITNAATARTNLGLGTASTATLGTSTGQVPTADQIPSLVPSGAAVVGTFRNLQLSANGTSANISVSADEITVENASNAYATLRSVSLTIAGTTTGANALDTGTIATSTWYSVWIIYNGTTTAGLISTSATAPTLPGGYTHKARVGWIRTDGTGNKYPLAFKQFGRRVRYTPIAGTNLTYFPTVAASVAGTALAATSVTWSGAQSVTSVFPSTASLITAMAINNGFVALSDSTTYDGNGLTAVRPAPYSSSANGNGDKVLATFPYTASLYVAGNAGTPSIYGIEWEDNL